MSRPKTTNVLQRLALRLSPDRITTLLTNGYAVQLPPEWTAAFIELQKLRRPKSASKIKSANIAPLNQIIAATLADPLTVTTYVREGVTAPWLYSQTPVNLDQIRNIVDAYVTKSFPDLTAEQTNKAFQIFDDQPLEWIPWSIDLANWTTSVAGTCIAPASAKSTTYTLLAQWAGGFLSGRTTSIMTEHGPLQFYQVRSDNEIELISWPPQEVIEQTKNEPRVGKYSYLITITVRTVPFVPYPMIYVHSGIRRWVSRPIIYLPHRLTTYFKNEVPIPGSEDAEPQSRATFLTTTLEYNRTTRQIQYQGILYDALQSLVYFKHYPSAEELAADPDKYLSLEFRDPQSEKYPAAIVHSTRLSGHHPVGTGMPLMDMRTITKYLLEQAEGQLLMLDPLLPISGITYPHDENFALKHPLYAKTSSEEMKAKQEREQAQQRIAQAMSKKGKSSIFTVNAEQSLHIGSHALTPRHAIRNPKDLALYVQRRSIMAAAAKVRPLGINIYAISAKTDLALRTIFRDRFGFETQPQEPLMWETDELALLFRTRESHIIPTPLDIDPTGKSRADVKLALAKAQRKRIEEILAYTKDHTEQGTFPIAIVEIYDRDHFARPSKGAKKAKKGNSTKQPESSLAQQDLALEVEDVPATRITSAQDPYWTIRRAFAQQGVLTKFITWKKEATDSNLNRRAIGTVIGLLKQVTQLPKAPGKLHPDLPGDEVNYIGIYLIKNADYWTGTDLILPVAVWLNSNSDQVLSISPAQSEWLPHAQTLLNLAIHAAKYRSYTLPELAMSYIEKQIILTRPNRKAHTIFMVNAHNLRTQWTFFLNGNILPDRFFMNWGETPVPLGSRGYENMSFARIIAGSTTETPRYIMNKIDDPDNISITAGLYQINSHVFMGIHDRPSQHKQARNISKMIEWNYQKTPKGKSSRNAPEPGKEIWNQRLAEYSIVTHDERLALPIASAVHALRHVAPHYNSALQFPLPLHLAEDMHEYAGIIYDNNEGSSFNQ